MYAKEQKFFGPKSNLSNFHGIPLQSGQGIGSWLGKLARGVGNVAKKSLKIGKKFVKSDFAQEVGNSLLQNGVNAASEIIANVIDPNKESNFVEEAQSRVNSVRSDIADILRQKKVRKRKKETINEYSSDSEEEVAPVKKIKIKKTSRNKKKSKKS